MLDKSLQNVFSDSFWKIYEISGVILFIISTICLEFMRLFEILVFTVFLYLFIKIEIFSKLLVLYKIYSRKMIVPVKLSMNLYDFRNISKVRNNKSIFRIISLILELISLFLE